MSTTLTITFEAPEVAAAINHLADAIAAKTSASKAPEAPELKLSPTPIAPFAESAPASASAMPVASPTPVQQPVTPVAPAAPIPTAVPTYDIMTLANACSPLMDAGRQKDLQDLLKQFGANMLSEIPQDQYGAFAEAIRRMGAKI